MNKKIPPRQVSNTEQIIEALKKDASLKDIVQSLIGGGSTNFDPNKKTLLWEGDQNGVSLPSISATSGLYLIKYLDTFSSEISVLIYYNEGQQSFSAAYTSTGTDLVNSCYSQISSVGNLINYNRKLTGSTSSLTNLNTKNIWKIG